MTSDIESASSSASSSNSDNSAAKKPETTAAEPPKDAKRGENDPLVLTDETPDDAQKYDTRTADAQSDDKPVPTPAPPPPPENRSVFLPMVLGGIIAAGLGYLAAIYSTPSADSGVEDALRAEIATLKADFTSQGEVLSAAQDELAAAQTQLSETLDALSQQIAEAPQGDPTLLSDELQATLAAQKGEIGRLQAELEKMASFAQAQIAAAEAEQESAAQAEARVKARGALNAVRDALNSGSGFSEALPDIEAAVAIPDGLSAVAVDGAPSLSALQGGFAEAARSALSAATRETAGSDTSSRLRLFIQDQLGARSLTPREGDDPDAVLSRAEAAVRSGDLASALETLGALPGSGQAAMADWMSQAQTRMAALAGFQDISNALSEN